MTAHANRDALIELVGSVAPHTVLLGHGEASSRQWIEDQIRERHPNIKVIQPAPGISVDI